MKIADCLPSPITDAIYQKYKEDGDSNKGRGYLGMSEIGCSCERYLWFKFRGCTQSEISGRLYRLFKTGDIAEGRFVADLRSIGCEVYSTDENGEQFAVSDFGGHFSGHMDGCCRGLPGAEKSWHVLEFKTHNDKSFQKLKKDGVQKTKYQHWCQCQCYMHYSGMNRALYLAVNKNDDDLYAERVHYDKEFAKELVTKAERIITATAPPTRISDRPDYYECRWCDAHDICWGCEKALPIPEKSCRQCCYATPDLDNGKWYCSVHGTKDWINMDYGACEGHLCLPGLFPYAEPVDYTEGMIVFKNKNDGKEWHHGGFCLSTDELMQLNRSEL